jgi:peroxiredoxin Q/BCP
VIVGASYDPPDANLSFSVDQELPFPLVSDVDGSVADAFGVRRPPRARWHDYPERRTFLIDPDGVVQVIYDVADVYHHPQQVLDDLRELIEGAPS